MTTDLVDVMDGKTCEKSLCSKGQSSNTRSTFLWIQLNWVNNTHVFVDEISWLQWLTNTLFFFANKGKNFITETSSLHYYFTDGQRHVVTVYVCLV